MQKQGGFAMVEKLGATCPCGFEFVPARVDGGVITEQIRKVI